MSKLQDYQAAAALIQADLLAHKERSLAEIVERGKTHFQQSQAIQGEITQGLVKLAATEDLFEISRGLDF